jgi:hypothetical protein
MCSIEALTAAASTGVPSSKVMPWRSVRVSTVLFSENS